MLRSIFNNFFNYDIIIFILGSINIFLFIKIAKYTNNIESEFTKTSYLQNEWLFNKLSKKDSHNQLYQLKDMMNEFTGKKIKLDKLTSFYISITSIFPLMGILGTVISLLKLGDFTSKLASESFSMALTSTFWGILFAAISKMGEGFFLAKIDSYDKLYHEIRANFIKIGDITDKESRN